MNGFLGNLVSAVNSKSKVELRLAAAFESPVAEAFEPLQTVYGQMPDPAPVQEKLHPDFSEQISGPVAENNFFARSSFTAPLSEGVADRVINPEKAREAAGAYQQPTGTTLQPIINIKEETPVMPVFVPDASGNTTEDAGLWAPVDNKERPYFQETGKEASAAGAHVINGNFTNNRIQQAAAAFSLTSTFNAFGSSGNLTEINNHLAGTPPVPPVVKISIGRIDIKAVTQTPAVREAKKQTPGISLDDLLKKKNK
ncbi:MAG TPA: hypothetical protein VF421_09110 [Niabella sp.]